ncbi:RluA family pseudouridine synthase [Marinihelvus fidelis]|uniref:Pseudouridine synthase n=1 Tax=Marinihelvus fidelis TaxID=2613842 RepID=A0A5N0TFB2_9GAMM|nr:RluA family pseudouridine synthase [Marinihelvus fidelis]KAA9131939.1 RluA family pseudouridine synthase [Marinihelvus fidelis]
MNEPQIRARAKTVEVGRDRDGQRLDNFLMARLPGVPRSAVYKLIRTGQVRVNGGRAKPFQKLSAGDQVRVPPAHVDPKGSARVPDRVVQLLENSVIFEDDRLLVCDKPSGIAAHGGSGVAWGVIDAYRQSRPGKPLDLVHRLDRETSGVMVLAKDVETLRHLQEQFAGREAEKRYFALLEGRVNDDRTLVDEPLARREVSGERLVVVDEEGKPAQTEFTVLERWRDATLVEARPLTGRTHQIRVHAAWLGCACAGDSRYGDRERQPSWKEQGLERLFLHAHALAFNWIDDSPRMYSSPLPDDLRAVTEQLGRG